MPSPKVQYDTTCRLIYHRCKHQPVLFGEKNDTVTPPEVADEFNTLLPDSNLYWIEKCGHAPMMEHPQEFNKILHHWLKTRQF